MSLTISNLSVLAYANNFTLWHYKTSDADVTTGNYFNNAADMMNEGDLIIATANAVTDFYIVTDITSGVVTVESYSSTLE